MRAFRLLKNEYVYSVVTRAFSLVTALLQSVLLARYLAEDQVQITAQGLVNARVTGKQTLTSDDNAKILSYLAGLLTKEQLAP